MGILGRLGDMGGAVAQISTKLAGHQSRPITLMIGV
jgi:hypothetical protein